MTITIENRQLTSELATWTALTAHETTDLWRGFTYRACRLLAEALMRDHMDRLAASFHERYLTPAGRGHGLALSS